MIATIRRWGRAFAAPILVLAGVSSGAAPALGADVVGTVRSVDRDAKTVVVVREDTGRAVTVKVVPSTSIEIQDGRSIDLDHLIEGTRVVVHDDITAAAIRVENEVIGVVRSVDPDSDRVVVSFDDDGDDDDGGRDDDDGDYGDDDDDEEDDDEEDRSVFQVVAGTVLEHEGRGPIRLEDIRPGQPISVVHSGGIPTRITVEDPPGGMVGEFWENFRHNLFKPLLLFFYAGFLIPILGVKFEFPPAMYQGLTIYLLIAIGWHGGEELAQLDASSFGTAAGFMGVGFVTNLMIGLLAYGMLRAGTRLRRVDAATVAGYYGSDSAGTFVTCLGVLASLRLAYAPYMPVMLAIMEIPGCLVALILISTLRKRGMDRDGNCPDEPDYSPEDGKSLLDTVDAHHHDREVADEEQLALEREYRERHAHEHAGRAGGKPPGILSKELLHEVFFNPGIYLLFAGILIGFVSRMQGTDVTSPDDRVFLDLFPGLLCLFLLEMGMTASKKLKDLKIAGPRFIAFGLLAPNVFAAIGIGVAHGYSMLIGEPFDLGTYALFAVLCGAASYIAVPAVQRLAIPEASPTLPLAASLGLTFSYNVTIGIPVYIEIAKLVTRALPVG